jgi:cytochrome c-type biogenesis protein CcmF
VLLGTLYPLFLDALRGEKISIGTPWFEIMFPICMVPALFVMGIGPIARWKEAKVPELAQRLKWAFGVAVVSAILVPMIMGKWTPLVALGLLLATWIAASGIVNLRERLAQLKSSNPGVRGRLRSLPRGYWGMLVAHLGIAVFLVGVTMVRGYETEKDVRMMVGDTVEVGGYTFRLDGLEQVKGPNYDATRGHIQVLRNGREVTLLHPEKRFYPVQQMPMTEADMDSGILRDLYVSLGEPVGGGAWVVRVYHKPFIDWIWAGCFLMAIGGVIAVTDRRYRLARREQERDARVKPPAAPAQSAPVATRT